MILIMNIVYHHRQVEMKMVNRINNVNVYCSADCDCSLILVPEYQKDTFYDDIVGINQKESYISAAEQFVKCCHPPIRLF